VAGEQQDLPSHFPSLPMENSPPGIHTMPSGAGLGGFEELATVEAKDEVSFATDETRSTAYALRANASVATAVNGRSLLSFTGGCFFLVRIAAPAAASIADVVAKSGPAEFPGCSGSIGYHQESHTAQSTRPGRFMALPFFLVSCSI